MLLGRGLVIMKLKSSLALLVVFTLLMTSIVCSANVSVNTTTTYTAGGFSVTTTATGLENGSMVAYAIYGPGSFDSETGSITNGTDSSITVGTDGTTNIKYIDQQTVGEGGSVTFTTAANSSALANFAGAKIKLGSSSDANHAALAATAPVIDETMAVRTLSVADWDANLGYVKVEVMGGESVAYTVNLTENNKSVKVLAGSNIKLTFVPKMGYKLADSGYMIDGSDIGITSAVSTYVKENVSADMALVLGACTARSDAAKWLSVNTASVDGNELMVLMNNQTGTTVGVDVTVKNGDDVVATVTGLSALDDNESALSGYCGVILRDQTLVQSGYTYEITPYYVSGDSNVNFEGGVTADGITTYSLAN